MRKKFTFQSWNLNDFNEAYRRLCKLYRLTTDKPKEISWQSYVESKTQKKIEAIYDYHSITNCDYAYTKLRLTGKQIIYGILKDERFSFGIPRSKPRKSYNALYGNLTAIKKAVAEGQFIFITEGEKDTDTMTKQGYPACTYGGSNDWFTGIASFFQDADVIVLADNDKPGLKVANQICADLKGIAKSAKVILPIKDKAGADITDFFEQGHTKEELETMIAEIEPQNEISVANNVYSLLAFKTDSRGQPKIVQTVKNFETVFEHDERFAGRIRFDCFALQTYLMGSVPWEQDENCRPWGSYDDSALFSILQADYGLTSRNDFFDALKNVSMRNKFHPVRDLLESLEWDGQEHISNLLPDYLGAEPCEYNNEVMRLFLLGAVSRIYKPGCKFDYTMILQGRQGIGKSTFLKLLAMDDAWFNDSLDSLDGDKSAQSLMGTWIVELAELKSLARTAGGVDSVKRFLTAVQDKYRRPYERRADIFLRQCVFAGSTNKNDFLQDETGNRRFLIVETGMLNEEIVFEIQQNHNTKENLQYLYERNLPLIAKAVKPYVKDNFEMEDAMQSAFIGLYNAAMKYSGDLGIKFTTFFIYHIKNAVKEYMYEAGLIRQPRHLQEAIYKYKKFINSFEMENGRAPTKDEIETLAGISPQKQDTIKRMLVQIKSLDEPILSEDEEGNLYDLLVTNEGIEEDVLDKAYKEQQQSELWRAVDDSLNDRESNIVKQHFLFERTMEQIGAAEGISSQRAHQIVQSSLNKFKMRNSRLLNEYAKSECLLYHSGLNTFKNRRESVVERVVIKRIETLEEYERQKQKDYEKYLKRIKKS